MALQGAPAPISRIGEAASSVGSNEIQGLAFWIYFVVVVLAKPTNFAATSFLRGDGNVLKHCAMIIRVSLGEHGGGLNFIDQSHGDDDRLHGSSSREIVECHIGMATAAAARSFPGGDFLPELGPGVVRGFLFIISPFFRVSFSGRRLAMPRVHHDALPRTRARRGWRSTVCHLA